MVMAMAMASLLGLLLPFLSIIENAVAFQPSRPLSIRSTDQVRPTPATVIHRQPPSSWKHHHTSSWDNSNKQSSTTTTTNTQRPMMTLLYDASATADAAATTTTVFIFQNTDTWVFLAGVFPFAWATVEFWRRVMKGESFGTSTDSIVIIGKDDAPTESRGRRVLGKGALITAYVLFAIAFGTIGVVLYSVLSSAPPPTEFLSSSSSTTAVTVTPLVSP
jgi:hypothetical protein